MSNVNLNLGDGSRVGQMATGDGVVQVATHALDRTTETVIALYGCSDDLFEVDGDRFIAEEFSASIRGGDVVAIDGGWLLHVEYAREGVWRFRVLAEGVGGHRIATCPGDDSPDSPRHWCPEGLEGEPRYSGVLEFPPYSDVAIIRLPARPRWILFRGRAIVRGRDINCEDDA